MAFALGRRSRFQVIEEFTKRPANPCAVNLRLGDMDRIEIAILESFPVQVHVRAFGYLPDSCTTISDVSQSREGDTFKVVIMTSRPADAVCAQVLVEFQEVIPLQVVGLPAGTYTVDVNGVTDTFTLAVDNVVP